MFPVLSREVVEGKQRVAILDQALDSLVIFDAPDFDEGVERGECILLGLGHPDLLERTLGIRLLALGQLVQHWRFYAPNSAGRASSATLLHRHRTLAHALHQPDQFLFAFW